MWMFLAMVPAGCAPAQADAPASTGLGAVEGGPPPIILVSLDTLRADRLGVMGNPDGLTPNLDAFARDATVFTSAWAQANFTLLSHASVFASLYPSEMGSIGNEFTLPRDTTTLAEVLGVYGYDTAAFTAAGQMSKGYGLEQGFGVFESPRQLGSLYHSVPSALSWLDLRTDPRPLFLLVHGYDTHAPYKKPAPVGMMHTAYDYDGPGRIIADRFLGTELVFGDAWFQNEAILDKVDRRSPWFWNARQQAFVEGLSGDPTWDGGTLGEADRVFLRDVYDGAVSYMDGWFGIFVETLKRRGWYDDAVIVVMGDHGESLGEHGLFNHTDSVYDEDLHVPLLVKLPSGSARGRTVAAQVALLDIMPTLLEMAGAEAPAGIRGHSLVPWLRGEDGPSHPQVFTQGLLRMVTVRTPEHRVTFNGLSADNPLFGPLVRGMPLDSPSWAASSTTDLVALAAGRDQLVAWQAGLATHDEGTPADPKLLEEMRARGYWMSK